MGKLLSGVRFYGWRFIFLDKFDFLIDFTRELGYLSSDCGYKLFVAVYPLYEHLGLVSQERRVGYEIYEVAASHIHLHVNLANVLRRYLCELQCLDMVIEPWNLNLDGAVV